VTIAIVAWLVAALGLVAAAARVTIRARRAPAEIVSRGAILAVAAALAALAAGSIWTWGGALATSARAERLDEGVVVHLKIGEDARIARAGDVLLLGPGTAFPGIARWSTDRPPQSNRDHGRAVLAIPDRVAAPTVLAAGDYRVAVFPIVPDPALVVARGARVAITLAAGPLIALVILALAPRRHRRAPRFAALARVAAFAALLAALAAWRLAWAYRVDVLRDLAPHGARVSQNLAGFSALGVGLVALCVHAWLFGGSHYSPKGARAPLESPPRLDLKKRAPELLLAGVGLAAIAGHALAPRAALVKLGLAWALVLVGYATLRDLLAPATPWQRRAWLAAGLVASALAVARYDAGVAIAIAGTGLAFAMIVAGRDAAYDAVAATRLGLVEREHARLVAVHAAAVALLAIGLVAAAILASDRAIFEGAWTIAVHALLGVAALFGISGIARSIDTGPRRSADASTPGVGPGRRAWLPWLCAALAALALWSARDRIVETVATGDSVGARRVAAVVDPGYALLTDERAFAANAGAWRESASAGTGGYFGATLRDPGVLRSIDNDYVAILLAREAGVGGVLATAGLLLAFVFSARLLALARFGPASEPLRRRALVTTVGAILVVYQPLAALGVLPLTGIGWPGFALDSPSDLLVLVAGVAWCIAGGDTDERIIVRAPRVDRARRLVVIACAVAALGAAIVIARATRCAHDRELADDARIDRALAYARTIACAPDRAVVGGAPTDAATTKFDAELRERWTRERAALEEKVVATGSATLDVGWPRIELTRTACTVTRPRDAIATLHAPRTTSARRIRVVGAPLGIAERDLGEVVLEATGAPGSHHRVVRLRAGGPPVALPDATIEVRTTAPRAIVLRGREARAFVVDAAGAWHPMVHGGETILDRPTLVVAGGQLALVRPGAATILADSGVYPQGTLLPELGWVNPYDVAHSVGLDGWIHAAVASAAATPTACGTLAPPAIARDQICAPSPHDGVLECRVALQPELARSLRDLARAQLDPAVRVAYVALRGDTGEILAQGVTRGDDALAYPPIDDAAAAALVALRDAPGESPRERPEWNLPIAVGSTVKPVLARAAELAFPGELAGMELAAVVPGAGCKARRGKGVAPIVGHCPPTSLAGQPERADVHDFLARSPNWFQAALGVIGLGLGPGARTMRRDGEPIEASSVLTSDLSAWSAKHRLTIDDVLTPSSIAIDPLRATPLWRRFEALLGRPLCTLGDRASCERAASRADVCAARGLPIASPSADLRYLVALGPSTVDLYADDRADQRSVPVREYLQLLRGSGVHAIGSLAQLADAFNRVVYEPSGEGHLAASWFPAPITGTIPSHACSTLPRERSVASGLCGVVQPGGTGFTGFSPALLDPRIVVYGAKTGTIDSLADIARRPQECARWNASHPKRARLACGKPTPDDSLFVVAFGVVSEGKTIPVTLALQLQRSGKGVAAQVAPQFVDAIADYLVGAAN